MEKSSEMIVKPKTHQEKKILKDGFEEDDNEDIAYLNLRFIIPVLITYIISGICVVLSIYLGITEDIYDSTPKNNPKGDIHLLKYGSVKYICKENNPPKANEAPSFLRLVELKSQTNMWLRKRLMDDHKLVKDKAVVSMLNSILPYIIFFEILFCSLFSIITVRHDFGGVMHISLHMFVYLAIIYMIIYFCLCTLTLPKDFYLIDIISLGIKFISGSLFCYFGNIVLNYHLIFMIELGCHPYVPYEIAVSEYIAIGGYVLYHFSHVTEIRNIRFICFPRTSSGECEPICSENFSKGGKYEYCRSFELRQRHIQKEKF